MPPRVLLADDDRDVCAVARLSLRRAGFEVVAVDSGEALLAEARTSPPDLVVLDWILSGMDGLETMRALHAEAGTAGVPVVFLTGRSEPADLARAMAGGAIGCLRKPFDPLALGGDVMRLFTDWQARP